MKKTTDFLVNLEAAPDAAVVGNPGLVNTHVHLPPNYSAFTSVAQAVTLAAQSHLQVLGADNYYDYHVYRSFARRTQNKGIFPLFNTEIIALDKTMQLEGMRVNDPANPGRYYIGGKGITCFDAPSAGAQKILHLIRENDQRRIAAMMEKIAAVFARHGVQANLDEATLRHNLAREYECEPDTIVLQERHVARAFQEILFHFFTGNKRQTVLQDILAADAAIDSEDAASCQQALRTHLMKRGKPGYVEEMFVSLAQARELIGQLGGIPCYPILADGAETLCEFEATPDILIDNLHRHHYAMAEFITPRNNIEVLRDYVTAVREAGMAVLAGTEHNTMILSDMLPQCRHGAEMPEDLRALFWEGACVAAAHQYLTARGEMGYVDEAGQPNPAFANPEDRIAYFFRLGANVISAYQKTLCFN